MRRVHREATERVLFIGSQPAWTEQPKRALAYCRMEEMAFCSTAYGRNGVLFIRKGLAYRRTEEMALCSTGHGGNGILFIGRGLAYRKTEETDLLRSKRGSC